MNIYNNDIWQNFSFFLLRICFENKFKVFLNFFFYKNVYRD